MERKKLVGLTEEMWAWLAAEGARLDRSANWVIRSCITRAMNDNGGEK